MSFRKIRGKTQKIYLLETIKHTDEYKCSYDVMGTTGNVYKVTICDHPICTCPDFITRHKRCKHIYFILTRVMQVSSENEDKTSYSNEDLITMFNNIRDITNVFSVDSTLKNRYLSLHNVNKIEMKDSDDLCAICLDDLKNGEDIDYCKYSCGKPIHSDCFNMYYKKKQGDLKCIYCNVNWNKNTSGTYINLL